jgi:serine/threonine-protein kinase
MTELPWRVRPELPVDLGSIVLRALAKDPAQRYATVEALVDDLERFRRHLPVHARAPSLGYRAAKFVRRHRVGVGVAAALAAGLGLGAYGLWRGAEDARAGEQLARNIAQPIVPTALAIMAVVIGFEWLVRSLIARSRARGATD